MELILEISSKKQKENLYLTRSDVFLMQRGDIIPRLEALIRKFNSQYKSFNPALLNKDDKTYFVLPIKKVSREHCISCEKMVLDGYFLNADTSFRQDILPFSTRFEIELDKQLLMKVVYEPDFASILIWSPEQYAYNRNKSIMILRQRPPIRCKKFEEDIVLHGIAILMQWHNGKILSPLTRDKNSILKICRAFAHLYSAIIMRVSLEDIDARLEELNRAELYYSNYTKYKYISSRLRWALDRFRDKLPADIYTEIMKEINGG